MKETSLFRALERMYATPGHEGAMNWLQAHALEKFGLVKTTGVGIVLEPNSGPAKRLVKLTKTGEALCQRRASIKRRGGAGAIPPSFWLGVVQFDE